MGLPVHLHLGTADVCRPGRACLPDERWRRVKPVTSKSIFAEPIDALYGRSSRAPATTVLARTVAGGKSLSIRFPPRRGRRLPAAGWPFSKRLPKPIRCELWCACWRFSGLVDLSHFSRWCGTSRRPNFDAITAGPPGFSVLGPASAGCCRYARSFGRPVHRDRHGLSHRSMRRIPDALGPEPGRP